MKNISRILWFITACILCLACEKQGGMPDGTPEPPASPGFTEAVADTIKFSNADFIYDGDFTTEGSCDGWIIKMYTDMEIDISGNPIGPGCVLQLMLNSAYDEEQSGDAEYLPGDYTEMYNSGNFYPGSFVSGYMVYLDLPGGERIALADGTFYADVADGTTEMDHDLIDEGALNIIDNKDGTYTVEGILVGGKYTKRYFTWTGIVEPKNNVPQKTPNSTLKNDIIDPALTKGILQDKKDYFYLNDQSYRCLLLFLAEDQIGFSYGKPSSGNGKVLRLEMLVPWDTDIKKDGIPAGTYTMTTRNPDTSIDRDKIVPGAAVPGLPDVFALWKMAGTWYYEMQDGAWTDTYARIDHGTITISRGEDGSHTIAYDLLDCQKQARRINGSTTLNELEIY